MQSICIGQIIEITQSIGLTKLERQAASAVVPWTIEGSLEFLAKTFDVLPQRSTTMIERHEQFHSVDSEYASGRSSLAESLKS